MRPCKINLIKAYIAFEFLFHDFGFVHQQQSCTCNTLCKHSVRSSKPEVFLIKIKKLKINTKKYYILLTHPRQERTLGHLVPTLDEIYNFKSLEF